MISFYMKWPFLSMKNITIFFNIRIFYNLQITNVVRNKLISKPAALMATQNVDNFKLLFIKLTQNQAYNKTRTNIKLISQNQNWKYPSMSRKKLNKKNNHKRITSIFGKKTNKMMMIYMLRCWRKNGSKEINRKKGSIS